MLFGNPIGVLGGMGPEATVLLQRKLIDAVSARDDSDHIPLLIDMNSKVPSRIAHLIDGTGEDPAPVLAAMARRLEVAGAAALAMPCNTAHYYAPAIVKAVNIPLLNMVELAADRALAELGVGGVVGMLASPAVRRTRLFENALEGRGLSVVWPKDDAPILVAIRAVKVSGPCDPARQVMVAASDELAVAGAGLQLVACSEFSLIAESVASGVHAVDTVDLLTAAILGFHRAMTVTA